MNTFYNQYMHNLVRRQLHTREDLEQNANLLTVSVKQCPFMGLDLWGRYSVLLIDIYFLSNAVMVMDKL
jgi:hypothetical protein